MVGKLCSCSLLIGCLSGCLTGCRPPLIMAHEKVERGHSMVGTVEAHCCTSPCWPGGLLGPRCTLDLVRGRLRDKAHELGADAVTGVSCGHTEKRCNLHCESPPGTRVECTGTAVRWK